MILFTLYVKEVSSITVRKLFYLFKTFLKRTRKGLWSKRTPQIFTASRFLYGAR